MDRFETASSASSPLEGNPQVANSIAIFLQAKGIRRVFGLCGGHIQPLWDELSRVGIQIVDVRHESSAVYMAHAEAELGDLPGVALVTAGPGLTNAVTGIANADKSQVPVLVISGRPPRPQVGMGAMQDVPQDLLVQSLCRFSETVNHSRHALPRLEEAWGAALGHDGPSGPAYLDFPTDVLREHLSPIDLDPLFFRATTLEERLPSESRLQDAASLLRRGRRILVMAGRGARGAGLAIERFLEQTGGLYLDSVDSRGVLSVDHAAAVPALRSKAIREADTIVTLGRRLDFQLAYGSPTVFGPSARLIRIGRTLGDTQKNRLADVQLQSDVAPALSGLLQADSKPEAPDEKWLEEMKLANASRRSKFRTGFSADWSVGSDGRMHPYHLLDAINDVVMDDTVVVADGGDILSFARVALSYGRYLDCGPLGCLGVGVPFAIAAALNSPNRRVIAVVGDGSFGFTAIEVETAVRTGAKAVFIVANNDAWNIERMDQLRSYDGNLVGVELSPCRYDLLAKALGAHGERVEQANELPQALERALANAPAVIDVAITRDAESPDLLSGLAECPSFQPLRSWDDAELQNRGLV